MLARWRPVAGSAIADGRDLRLATPPRVSGRRRALGPEPMHRSPDGRIPALVRRDLPGRARRQEPADGHGLRRRATGRGRSSSRSPWQRCSSTPAPCSSGPRSPWPCPRPLIQVVAGIAFFAFAAWTLRGDELGESEEGRARRTGRWALLTIGTAFFLAELGDKTMLATITLADDRGADRDLARVDGRHGRGRRPGDRRRSAPGHPPPGACGQDPGRRRRSSCSGPSSWPRGSASCSPAGPGDGAGVAAG